MPVKVSLLPNWIPLSDYLPQIGVSGIAIDHTNSDIIYIATGDKDASDTYSIGVLKSIDGGLTWKDVSLVGEVDFHFLEGAGSDLYGADSQSGNLMYSKDSGKTWSSLGTNSFTDIAVSPVASGVAIAIRNSELLLTKNAFKSNTAMKNILKFTQIEWRKSGLYALSGTSLYKSSDSGRTWAKLNTFKVAPEILSASDQLMMVTVGSDLYTSSNAGKKFKIIS